MLNLHPLLHLQLFGILSTISPNTKIICRLGFVWLLTCCYQTLFSLICAAFLGRPWMQRNPVSTMYTGIIFIKFFKLSKCETTNACVLSISSKCKISPLLLFVFNGCCGFWFCVSTVTCILIRHLHRYCVELELLIKMIYVVKQRRETTTFSGLNLSPF